MRVGVYIPTLNVCGGAEYVAVTMANALARKSYEVVLFTNEQVNQQKIQNFFGVSLNPSIKCIIKPSLARPYYLLDFYETIFRSYIFKSKCDIWIDVYSRRIFPWTNITYIHYPYSSTQWYRPRFPYLKSGRFLKVAALPYVIFEKNLVSDNGKLILANSGYTAEAIRTFLNRKVQILYPPISSIYFNSDPEYRLKSKRKNLVITISRFDPSKRLERVPYIASLTKPDINFVIIGRVHDSTTSRILISLQKLTKKLDLTARVKILTNVSRYDMMDILRRAKVYLHTAVGEHFGISIVEAMAMGCIPIVHDSGGPRELLPKQLRYKTINEAAEKIVKEIHEFSPQKAMKMIKIAEKFKEENFSKRFIKLFEQYKNNYL